ncbi:hypothetical protein DPEC_G00296000 [Dallia pectoralis]|uniref:Uncharacterized protein n=1 Tax=Dallia pectoralis TaxID=75939 RepID=A0ACC2FJ89_DALPE|nr:hypothetical protein DPEC_G00296000 [Dallia pectoralis]
MTTESSAVLKDLSYLQRRDFKVHGGQVGDQNSDLTYNNISKQIDGGVKEGFADAEVVRGVLRIIKLGAFKDMLVNKDSITVSELKGFLRSHLGEKAATEMFQELMCARQSDQEPPQQFLYRMIGLKQKILFQSRQTSADISYDPGGGDSDTHDGFVDGTAGSKYSGVLLSFSSNPLQTCPTTAGTTCSPGSQVSIVDQQWTDTHNPNQIVRPISELLDEGLGVYAVTGHAVPYSGWVELTVNLAGNEDPNLTIQAPFLVSPLPLPQPLLGANVLQKIIRRKESSGDAVATVVSLLCSAFGVEEEQLEAIVNVSQVPSRTHSDPVTIRVGRNHAIIPPGRTVQVWCRIPPNFDLSDPIVLYEPAEESVVLGQLSVGEGLLEINNIRRPYVKVPISNHSKHDVMLPRRTPLGTIQQVVKVLETDAPESHQACPTPSKMTSVKVNSVSSPSTSSSESWLPPVDISHLTSEQQQAINEVLSEECGAFARNSDDIGCIPSLQMEIRTKDDIPVQRAYASIPKPLYREVKEYIQELLVKGWIVKSQSPYSAPVICVRKKDGSLRLCVDYRLLNNKTVPDRHPLPRIQDLTDSLGGYAWFSILDQGKPTIKALLPKDRGI